MIKVDKFCDLLQVVIDHAAKVDGGRNDNYDQLNDYRKAVSKLFSHVTGRYPRQEELERIDPFFNLIVKKDN